MAKCYLLACECDHKITVETRHAGSSVDCPECGISVNVPKFRDLKNLEPAESSQDTSKANTTANPLKGLLFAFGLGVAVVAGLGGWMLYAYASDLIVSNDFDVDQKLEFANEPVDDATAGELWDVWYALIEGGDLPDWQEADWNKYYKQGTILRNFAYGILGLAGVGLLVALSSFFVGSKKS